MMSKEEKAQLIKDKTDEFDKQLTYVKIDLLKNETTTFLTSEVFKRPVLFVPDLPVPTAGANGKEILIDPECWANTTRPKRLGILFHEGFHNMMGHCDIKSTSQDDHIMWNLAMDCVTEALRVTCDVGEQIEEAAIKPSHDGNVRLKINDVKIILPRCHEKTKEEIHDIIVAHVKKNPPKGGGGMEITDEDGNKLKDIDNHDLREFSPEERAEMEQNLRQMVVENKMKGTLPKGLADALERMLTGKINWKAELRDMILPEIKSYQSYNRINRRSHSLGLTLPGMQKEGVDAIFAFDTSGSMGKKELMAGMGQIADIFKQFEPGMVNIKVMLHNSDVYSEVDLKDVHEVKDFKVQSGGTSHADVFEKAEGYHAKVLICFTDGYSNFPNDTNINKVLWVVSEENGMKQIPDNLGKKIYVPMDELTGEE